MYIPPELDARTKEDIRGVAGRAISDSADSVAAEMTDKIGSSGGLIGGAEQVGEEAKYGGVDRVALEAIQRKSHGKYNEALKDIGARARLDGSKVAMQRKMQAMDLLNKENEYNNMVQELKRKAAAERRRARAGVLGSIMGIGGAAVGLAASGGNPMGAMAGLHVGQGIGQAAGGGI